MIISYHGAEFIKITQGDTTVAFNPISKESKLSGPKFGADIVLISTNDRDMNGVEQVTYGEKEPLVIQGPGEYEVEKMFVKGFPSVSHYSSGKATKEERPNTLYMVTMEGVNLCFLGALSEKKVDPKIFEDIEEIDVLFVPIGGGGVLSASEAHEVAVMLEPRLVIPIHYGEGMENPPAGGALKTFLKEGGAEDGTALDKLTIKKKDLEGKTGEIIVLTS